MNCPVCDSVDVAAVYTGRDRTVASVAPPNQAFALHLVRCRACDMMFLNNADYDLNWVHELYWKMMVGNVSEGHSVEIETLRRYLAGDLAKYRVTGNLLEIGCGEGAFLAAAAAAGWNVTGVEVSQAASMTARSKHGLNVLTGTPEEHMDKLAAGTFDIVVMWGLLEHVRNPGELLGTVRRLVRDGGAVLLYIPNADSIFHRLARLAQRLTLGLLKGPMECVIIAMHPMYFTRKTVTRILKDSGFLVDATEMTEIDLKLVFQFYRNSWWSNGALFFAAKLLQAFTRLFPALKSHMILLARADGGQRGAGGS